MKIKDMLDTNKDFSIFAGPCAIESYNQLDEVARKLKSLNLKFIRAGAFKPRTSPFDFQGLGNEGLAILNDIKRKYGLISVTEVLDTRDVQAVALNSDIIQIGSRNMDNFALLKEVGKARNPILLKRGFMSTVSEFLLAAEYIMASGNDNILMCERGIRTFETSTRNTLDISCAAIIKKETSLPVIVDVSHSLGRKDIVVPISKAVAALGADGLMVEVHPSPQNALSDKNQQLNLKEFEDLIMALNI